jgi:hypothetical protein
MKFLTFSSIALLCAGLTALGPTAAGQTGKPLTRLLTLQTAGFDKVTLSSPAPGTVYRRAKGKIKPEYGLTQADLDGRLLGKFITFPVTDQVPVTLSEITWVYLLKNDKGALLDSAETTKNWPEALFPSLALPKHPAWVTLYKKAWELNWKRIVTSKALPARFAYNATPDNSMSYVWDACFNLLFQRYAAMAGADAGVATLDNFYAIQAKDGFINRHFNTTTFAAGDLTTHDKATITGVNPPLFAWAEWDYYLMSANRDRLRQLLPVLIRQYEFIDSFLQETPGRYIWGGNPSGWDNILEIQPHKYWVELPAMQALSAKCIMKMAGELKEEAVAARFQKEMQAKQAFMEMYWNKDKNWYCSLNDQGAFTGKTLSGLWAMLAGIVPVYNATLIKQNLMDTAAFLTYPMPLPSVAKNENGYDPAGKYWHGSVWVNTSLLAIRSLEEYGFSKEATELAERTLNGMVKVYEQWAPHPNTLWECYAPEFVAPASHKVKPGLGSVRTDFADWTCCLINLLIENIMGIKVDAPANSITWDLRLPEEYGIRNLRFAGITTDLVKTKSAILVNSNQPYTLYIIHGKNRHELKVNKGKNAFHLKQRSIKY